MSQRALKCKINKQKLFFTGMEEFLNVSLANADIGILSKTPTFHFYNERG